MGKRGTFDDSLKSCQECRMVWQTKAAMQKSYYSDQHDYYKDFPHYGLEKVTCPRCKGKEIQNGVNA
tara:strand:- start:324 stop:524 length:201 start_codon:yes stop_codon:yes gene_type:complete